MRLQGVGGRKSVDDDAVYLAHDWYRDLSDQQLAAYVRYLFIYFREGTIDWDSSAHADRRPHWDGGTDKFGTKHKSVWSKIVAAIRSHNAIPGVWVAAHFSSALHAVRVATGKNIINGKPEILGSDISPRVYREYIENFDAQLQQQYASAEASISTRYTITDAFNLPEDDHVLLVLGDTSHVNAPPFLRHAFADELNCQRAVNKFVWPAAIDYETKQPLYDKFIEGNSQFDWFVSSNLKKFVANIRKHWRRYA